MVGDPVGLAQDPLAEAVNPHVVTFDAAGSVTLGGVHANDHLLAVSLGQQAQGAVEVIDGQIEVVDVADRLVGTDHVDRGFGLGMRGQCMTGSDADVEHGRIAIEALSAQSARPLAVLIGPEGGFEEEERTLLIQQPFVLPVSLGPRVMRADTAAVACLALVNAVLGDWR